jgi:hypothetical protein
MARICVPLRRGFGETSDGFLIDGGEAQLHGLRLRPALMRDLGRTGGPWAGLPGPRLEWVVGSSFAGGAGRLRLAAGRGLRRG